MKTKREKWRMKLVSFLLAVPVTVVCQLQLAASWLGEPNSETAGEVLCNDISTVRQMSLQPVLVSSTSHNGCLLIPQNPSLLHPPLNTPTYLIQS
ncbi:hypothetical protein QQF64_028610 [Cirrhinus molitorella]|uniref:Uncharacterized protein n=1 Tax=Cirrhinus molitorella TaxID=172907 RepID=A0ABR3N730_9TELE